MRTYEGEVNSGFWTETIPPLFPDVCVSIPARTGVGKLPVAGIMTQMSVLPPQGQNDDSPVAAPDPVMDSCSVGESKSSAYVKGLVEGVDVTVLIDSGSNL